MPSKNVTQAYSLISERGKTMMNSKFIMSSNCISSILKTIASIPVLTNYLIKCSQDFSFDQVMDRATSTSKFTLPAQQKEIVAFVTELLYKFDRKDIDLTKFIKIYYPSKNFEASYKMFTQDIILPYIMAFNGIVREEETKDIHLSDVAQAPAHAAKTQATQYILALTELVTNDNNLKDELRDDYLLMLEGFLYSFELNRTKMIKVVWTGLKSVMAQYKPAVSYIAAIEKILATYALI